MKELINLGLEESEIENLILINDEIKDLSDYDIKDSIQFLRKLNITDEEIKGFIQINPLYLNRSLFDMASLIMCLKQNGIEELKFLILNNPLILNYDDYEIENFFTRGFNNGKLKDEIISEIETIPFVLNEN